MKGLNHNQIMFDFITFCNCVFAFNYKFFDIVMIFDFFSTFIFEYFDYMIDLYLIFTYFVKYVWCLVFEIALKLFYINIFILLIPFNEDSSLSCVDIKK